MRITLKVFQEMCQPQYTGENRCLPCTIINSVIVAGLTLLVGWIWWPLGLAVLIIGIAAIWFCGYLVPGTPVLTERYAPSWVLSFFEKPSINEFTNGTETDALLLGVDIIRPCHDIDDVCLDDAFRVAWVDRMESLHGGAEVTELADSLDLSSDSLTVESFDAAIVVHGPEGRIGQWESRAALIADLAALHVLPAWVETWDALSTLSQARLLSALRLFVENCPECGAAVALETDTVKSCCRSADVVAAGCTSCGARLIEVDQSESVPT